METRPIPLESPNHEGKEKASNCPGAYKMGKVGGQYGEQIKTCKSAMPFSNKVGTKHKNTAICLCVQTQEFQRAFFFSESAIHWTSADKTIQK